MPISGARRIVLVTDLDNTLYNWVDYFAPSFRAMVHVIAKETGIAEDIIIDDFREVYREHESIEYGPSVQELAICRTMSDSEVEHLKNLARTVFGQVGRKHLRPYDGVRETLLWATKVGLLIVCSTNAPINLAEWRLRQLGLISYFYGLAGRIPVGERRYEPYSRARMIWQLKSDELKPFTSGYRRIIADLSLKVSDLYVVGDNLEKDVRPAMQLGAVGIWARYGKSYQQKNLETIRTISTMSDSHEADESPEGEIGVFAVIDSFSALQEIIQDPPQMSLPGI